MKKIWKTLVVLCSLVMMTLLCCAIVACGDKENGETDGAVTYTVTVMQDETTPAKGVKVKLGSFGPYTTDASGKITAQLEEGTYAITLTNLPTDYTYTEQASVSKAAPNKTITLTSNKVTKKTYTVTVLLPDGSPVQGAGVGWCVISENGTGSCSIPVFTNAEGKASNEFADGRYHVQIIQGVPAGYTYEKIDNTEYYKEETSTDKRDLTITLKALPTARIEAAGDYPITIEAKTNVPSGASASAKPYMEIVFRPSKAGKYAISSKTSTYDPKVGYYEYRENSATYDELSDFAKNDNKSDTDKNFYFEVNVAREYLFNTDPVSGEINEKDLTAVVWAFRIFLNDTMQNGSPTSYPAHFTVSITRLGDADPIEERRENVTSVKVTETLTAFGAQEGHLTPLDLTKNPTVVYSAADKRYHLGSESGEVICAMLTKKTTYLDIPIINLDMYASNPFSIDVTSEEDREDLTKPLEYVDYRLFLRGTEEFGGTPAADAEYYVKYVNADGVYPVTQELKLFMERYIHSLNGSAIKDNLAEMQVSEENMWLFLCYYYSNETPTLNADITVGENTQLTFTEDFSAKNYTFGATESGWYRFLVDEDENGENPLSVYYTVHDAVLSNDDNYSEGKYYSKSFYVEAYELASIEFANGKAGTYTVTAEKVEAPRFELDSDNPFYGLKAGNPCTNTLNAEAGEYTVIVRSTTRGVSLKGGYTLTVGDNAPVALTAADETKLVFMVKVTIPAGAEITVTSTSSSAEDVVVLFMPEEE